MITYGHSLVFVAGKVLPVKLKNFFEPEDGYVWSTSKWCEIVFPFSFGKGNRPVSSDLILDLDVFKAPPKLETQPIMVYLNGIRMGQYDVRGQETHLITFPTALLREFDNSLVIDTPQSTRPSLYEIKDGRILGIQLFSAHIQPA